MLESPKLLRSSFRRKIKVEKVEKEEKKIFKKTTIEYPRWSRSSLHLVENPEKEKPFLYFSYSAEGYAQETATQINYDLNFFRKKVLYLKNSFFILYFIMILFKILTKGKII